MANSIRTSIEQGPTILVGETTVITRAQAITVDFPFAHLTCHRPIDVLVERSGYTRRHRLVDATRTLQLTFYGMTAAFVVLSLVVRQRR